MDFCLVGGEFFAKRFVDAGGLKVLFPFLDPAIERGMWWTLKVHGLMPMYYHGMLNALM